MSLGIASRAAVCALVALCLAASAACTDGGTPARSAAPAPAAGAAPATAQPASASVAGGAAAGAATAAAPLAGSQPAAAPRTLKFAVPGRGVAYLPLVVAQKQGILARHGLDADMQPLRQEVATAALSSGNVDYATSTFGGIAATTSGLPQKIAMVITGRPQHAIMAREPLGSVQELRGKSVVADVRGGILDIMVRLALQQGGLRPDADVPLLYAGTPDARLGMLVAQQVDAGAMDLVSTLKTREQGYHQVVDLGKVIVLPLAGLVVTPQRIQEQPDEIRTLARAILEGADYVRANRAETIKIIAEWSEVDEALAAQLYDLARDTYTHTGRITDDELRATIEAQANYQPGSPVDLTQFADFSLLP